jgi:hypothetical protein
LLAVSLPAYARGGHSGGGHSGGGQSGGAHATRSGGSHSSGSHGSGSHGSTGRTAHETPGSGHGHDGGHDGGHSGHFGGGHHHFGGGSRIFIGGGFGYDPFFYNFYYPFGYWGPSVYWGPDYDPYYNSRPRSYYDRDEMGALDLDVSPGRTHVFVDGQDLGEVDNFDGWPDYLWLPKGTYDVAFYLDGYKTIARQISIYPGNVIDIDDRMESGPSVRPEDLATKTHERRDERLSQERERERRYDGRGDDEGWRDRVRRDRGPRGDGDRADRGDRGEYRGRPPAGDDSARGRLHLAVQPEDASVYVDGRFVGTGSDLSMMRAGLPLAVGDHKLAIVRPGRQAQEKTFTVKAGEDVKLDVNLESGPG